MIDTRGWRETQPRRAKKYEIRIQEAQQGCLKQPSQAMKIEGLATRESTSRILFGCCVLQHYGGSHNNHGDCSATIGDPGMRADAG